MPTKPSESEVRQIAAQLEGRAHPQVAAALRERSDRILALWRELTLKAAPHLDRLTIVEFEDSIAAILEAVAAALESDDRDQVAGVLKQAPEHGFDRFLQKYDLYDLLTEERVLRTVVILEIELGLSRSLTVDEAASLHTFIDIMIQQGVMALVRKQKEDLTQAQAALRRDERLAALGTLATGISHDIGNLLLPVRARLDALAVLEIPDAANEHLERIGAAMVYLQNLVASLRQFAAESAPRHDTFAEPLNLHEWCEQAMPLFQSLVLDNIEIIARVPKDVPPALIDPTGLTQAVFNLVHNSNKAIGGKQGHIIIEASPRPADDDMLILAVTDNGPGMPPEVLAHALEPYYSTNSRGIATGLGLSLAHGIIKASGGDVTIRSPAPGQHRGVRIELHLPRAPEQTAVPRTASLNIADPRLRAIFRNALKSCRFDLREISLKDGELDGHDITLWITDATAEAETFARRLKSAAPRAAIIALGPAAESWSTLGARVIEKPQTSPRAAREILLEFGC